MYLIMTVLKKIFGFIWALWALIFFIFTLLIVTPLYLIIFLIGGKKAERNAHKLSRAWAAVLFFFFVVRLKVHGKEKLDPAATYIFVSNHASQLDIPTCALATDNFFKFLAKEELTKIPLLGFIIKKLYLTVSRQDKKDRARSMEKMILALKNNVSVWIYPEGTRNKTNRPLKEFYDGAFRLAVDSKHPIAVLTIVGAKKLLPPGEIFHFLPGVIHAYWSDPVEITETTEAQALKEEVMVKMMYYLVR